MLRATKISEVARALVLSTVLPAVFFLAYHWWRDGQIGSATIQALVILTGCICLPAFACELKRRWAKDLRASKPRN